MRYLERLPRAARTKASIETYRESISGWHPCGLIYGRALTSLGCKREVLTRVSETKKHHQAKAKPRPSGNVTWTKRSLDAARGLIGPYLVIIKAPAAAISDHAFNNIVPEGPREPRRVNQIVHSISSPFNFYSRSNSSSLSAATTFRFCWTLLIINITFIFFFLNFLI